MFGFDPIVLLPVLGFAVGTGLGYAARASRFCTLGALERHWYAGDSTGLRTWALAVAVAIAATQAMIVAGLIDLTGAFYLEPRLSLLGAVGGGLAFGLGMALVGTCGFGALIRLGGGSLRSLVVILVLAVAALAAQRGLVGLARVHLVERFALDLAPAADQSLVGLLQAHGGGGGRALLAALVSGAILAWVFRDGRYRRNGGQIAAGTAIGLLVAAGWLITATIRDHSLALQPVQLESASFVVTYADALLAVATVTGTIPDYGVGLLFGVLFGAVLASRRRRDLRWEACDDAHELKRHMLGALLMGVGGILAGGCTIGQGVSAASTLAVSAPVVMLSIFAGARVGLVWLMEGSLRGLFTPFAGTPAE
ncbi:YeeE/YedE family protein [Propylenella binzhouense]|uniref:YeeE/YedE family protein n=1 Tax=Propylenella binzhouense TaxID=2555902 RepID=A0A964WV82_9HYPH|nr:YeeE/YedE family protein [Propylenella binzhouense]MYZ49773.1 YeeE/YedE family protein [Propylenella binzhouense]